MLTLILAAGEGTRMKSNIPKVLHTLCGTPMIDFTLNTSLKISPKKTAVVLGYKGDLVKKHLNEFYKNRIKIFIQKKQLGSADALKCATIWLKKNINSHLLILCGDVPLISYQTLKNLINYHKTNKNDATILTTEFEDPSGYGRIIRENGHIRIIEEKDATDEQRKIKEINSGIYIFKIKQLLDVLPNIKNNNAKKEFYLTDSIGLLNSTNCKIGTFKTLPQEVIGINNRMDLNYVETILRFRKLQDLMLNGVTITDVESTYIDFSVEIGQDTVILPDCIIKGKTKIGRDCKIGLFSYIENSKIGDGVEVRSSFIYNSKISDNTKVGPFAHLRPGNIVEKNVKIGNFVELKKTKIKENTKVPHLTYLGDSFVGKDVNIGAGTITCNYDGLRKYPTFIGDRSFVGSNVNLVAPIKIGKGSIVGAGSTITENVPANSLALERAKQITKLNWVKKKTR